MNVAEFIKNEGKVEVPNPEYNPKSKNNKVSPTITVDDLEPTLNPLVDLARKSVQGLEYINTEDVEKYNRYGLNWVPKDLASGSLDKQLAKAQSNWEKLGNALAQTLVNEVALGTVKGFADLYDIILGQVFKGDNDYQNKVSAFLEQAQDNFRNKHGIYQDPTKEGWGHWSDFGWWMNNVPSIMSSLTLLIPGAGAGKAASLVGKLAGKGLKKAVGYSSKALRQADRIADAGNAGKIGKLENWINRPNVGNIASRALETTSTALAMRMMENYQEGRGVYNDMLDQALESLNSMSDEDKQAFIERNKDTLTEAGANLSDNKSIARAVAKASADKTFQLDMANLLFDVIQVYAIGNPLKLPKNLRATAKVNKAQREAKIMQKHGTVEGAKILADRSTGRKVADWFGDRIGAATIVGAELSEGVEEAVNYVAQQEGMYYGSLMLDPTKSDPSRFKSYLANSELYESAFWGVLGGVVFEGGGSGLRRATGAAINTRRINKKYNETTAEDQTGAGRTGKTTFKEQWYNAENNRRVAEINSRIEALDRLKERRTKIYEEGISPFTDDSTEPGVARKLETQIEKDAAWQRAVDDFIINQTFLATDAGNYDLLKEFLRDPGVRETVENLGKVEDNPAAAIDVENLIKRMDEISKIYTDNLITVNGIAGNLKRDIPMEYVNIIARDNTIAQIKMQRLNNRIAQYEQSAEANQFRFADALREAGMDLNSMSYRSAVELITVTNYLKELRDRKSTIENNKSITGSLDGQIELNNINKRIEALTNYIDENNLGILSQNTNERISKAINRLFAFGQSLNRESADYADFLKNVASRNINDYIGFEATDDELVKILGEKGTNTGLYHVLSEQLLSHFGVNTEEKQTVSKFVEVAPNLADDFTTLASLNVAKLFEKINIANTNKLVQTRVGQLNNEMNAARVAAISKSRDILIDKAKQYGSENVYNYVFSNIPIANITEEDKKAIDDALDVLNLTSETNQDLANMIRTNLLLADYMASVEAAEQQANSQEQMSQNAQSNTSQQASTQQGKPQPAPTPAARPIATQEAQAQPASPIERELDAKFAIKMQHDTDIDVNFSYTEATDNTAVRFYENEDGSLELAINDPNLTKEQRDDYVNNYGLFSNAEANKSNYRVVSNPVIAKQDGVWRVVKQGEVEYINNDTQSQTQGETEQKTQQRTQAETQQETQEETSATPPQPIASIGEEDSISDTSNPPLTDDDFKREQEDIRTAKLKLEARRIVNSRLLPIAKSLAEQGKTKEEILSGIKEEIDKILSENNNSSVYNEAIASVTNLIYKKYDLINVAAALNDVRYSTAVEKAKEEYSQGFIDRINKLVQEYAKVVGIEPAPNGKYYINLEDFIRNINNMYDGLYEGETIYNRIKGFLKSSQNTSIVITDNINDPDILDNARKSINERLEERIGLRSNYRVDIDSFFKADDPKFLETFDALQVGDKLNIVKENGKLFLVKDGTKIGALPIPTRTAGYDGFSVWNNGWLTDVYDEERIGKAEDVLKTLATNNEFNNIISSLLYDSLSNNTRIDLIDRAYDIIVNANAPIYGDADKAEVVGFVSKLWRYRMAPADFSKPAEERSIRIDAFLHPFFKKLYDSYAAITEAAEKGESNVEAEVSNINDGELIRVVELTEEDIQKINTDRDNYAKFTQSNKAFKNPNDVEVGAVTVLDTLSTSTRGNYEHSALGKVGTIHVLIPNRKGGPSFCIATTVQVNDTNLDRNSDAYKIIQESRAYIKRAVEAYINNKTEANYNNLVTCISDLMLHNKGAASIFYGADIFLDNLGNISIKSDGKYLKIYRPGTRNDGDFVYNNGADRNAAKPYNTTNAPNIIGDFLSEALNNCKFNLDFKVLNGKWNERNGAIGYTNDGKQYLIKVNGKVFKYKSLSDAFVNGGLLRVNTKVENGSNYRRKGENQAANQILEVSFTAKSASPVARMVGEQQTQQAPTSTELTGENILTTQSANKVVDALVENALPDLKDKNRRELKRLGLLPKSITFVESLKDNDGNEAVAKVDTKTKSITVTRLWLDMFDGNGQYASNRDFYKQQAMRKLIHEQLHVRIAEQGRDTIIKQIEDIYNDFKEYVHNASAEDKTILSKYLFDDKTNVEERLEEFLVESFTSRELIEKLNNIKAKWDGLDIDKAKAKKDTLWDKILKLIAKIFNYSFVSTDKNGKKIVNIDKKSLLQKELYALSGALNVSKPAFQIAPGVQTELNFDEEVQEEQTQEHDVDFGSIDLNNDDPNILYSTTVERPKGSNATTPTHLSVTSMLATLKPNEQQKAVEYIENGEISVICKL